MYLFFLGCLLVICSGSNSSSSTGISSTGISSTGTSGGVCGDYLAPSHGAVKCATVYYKNTTTTQIDALTTTQSITSVNLGRQCNATCNSGWSMSGSSKTFCDSTTLQWSTTLGSCADINECKNVNISKCPKQSVCVNSPGSFKCSCYLNYKLNTTTNVCDSKVFKCATDGSVCGFINFNISWAVALPDTTWQTTLTNYLLNGITQGDSTQFTFSFKPLTNGSTQLQITIAPYHPSPAGKHNNSIASVRPRPLWDKIEFSWANKSSELLTAYPSITAIVPTNPPDSYITHELALLGIIPVILVSLLCTLKKREEISQSNQGKKN